MQRNRTASEGEYEGKTLFLRCELLRQLLHAGRTGAAGIAAAGGSAQRESFCIFIEIHIFTTFDVDWFVEIFCNS